MSASRYASLRVLIVDDVRAMRLVIRSLLRGCGIEHIAEASDGCTALANLKANPFDLVISDLLMTPMDGLDFVRQLRRPGSCLNPTVPVLMVSGHMDAASVTAAIEAGVNEFLVKPLTPGAFRQRLDFMLDRPRPIIKTQHYRGPERRRRQLGVQQDRRMQGDIVEI